MKEPLFSKITYRLTDTFFFALIVLFPLFPDAAQGAPSTVHFEVVDSLQNPVPAKLVFLGLDANQQIDPRLFPNFDQLNYDPSSGIYWLGSKNVILTPTGMASVALDSGNYLVVASRGLEYSIAGDTISLPEMADTSLALVLNHMLDVPGRISVDYHVHSDSSNDARIVAQNWGLTQPTTRHRIIDFLTSGVDLMVATEHRKIWDYNAIIQALADEIGALDGFTPSFITEKITSIPGMEFNVYAKGPNWLPDCPPNEWPHQVNHFNGFAITPGPPPSLPCDDVHRQPATLYDLVRALEPPGGYRVVIQLSHPRGAHYDWQYFPGFLGGPHLGYFYNFNYDPTVPIPDTYDGSVNSFLRAQSDSSTTQNIDFDTIEILNRNYIPYYMESRDDWFSFLNQGFRKVAVGNTDSHWIFIDGAGYPRNYVASNIVTMDRFDMAATNAMADSLLYGEVFTTTGPIIDFSIQDKGLGDTVFVSPPNQLRLPVSITVRAAPWVPVQQVRMIVNGELAYSQNVTSTNPPNPFSSDPADLIRFQQVFQYNFTGNSWVIVEAGIKLPQPGVQPAPQGIYQYITSEQRVVAFTNPIFVKMAPQ